LSVLRRCPPNVRISLDSRHRADIPADPGSAISGTQRMLSFCARRRPRAPRVGPREDDAKYVPCPSYPQPARRSPRRVGVDPLTLGRRAPIPVAAARQPSGATGNAVVSGRRAPLGEPHAARHQWASGACHHLGARLTRLPEGAEGEPSRLARGKTTSNARRISDEGRGA
jgi:hypothetical protein